MKFLKIAGNDIKGIAKNRFVRVSVVAIIIVPLLYSLLYLKAFWDPYAKLDKVPVAIVNKDKGSILDNENVNYGQDLVDELKDDKQLGWKITNEEEGKKGLDGKEYYALIEIPENFSSSIVAAKEGDPKVAEVKFICNDKKNFLASQINSRVQVELKSKLIGKVNNKYATVAFDSLYEAKDGMVKAEDGSNQITDGLSKFKDKIPEINQGGSKLLDGSNQLKDGLGLFKGQLPQLSDGVNQLLNGTTQLKTGVEEMQSKLEAGSNDINKLASGAQTMNTVAPQLEKGAKALNGNIDAVNGALNSMYLGFVGDESNPQSLGIYDGVNSLLTGVNSTGEKINNIGTDIKKLLASNPQLINDPNIKSILGTLNQIKVESEAAKPSLLKLKQGNQQLHDGMVAFKPKFVEYNKNVDLITEKTQELAQGSVQLATGTLQLTSKFSEVSNGVSQISTGLNKLYDGQNTINSKIPNITEGVNKLYIGSNDLYNGQVQFNSALPEIGEAVDKLYDGSKELSTKLGEGSDKMTSGLKNSSEVMGNFLEEPVDVKADAINLVPNYGTGFAPYFIPLSLWIGAIMMFFVIPSKVEDEEATKFDKVFGKFISYSIIGAVQAILVSLVVLAIGLKPSSVTAYILTNVFLSLVFIAIIQCLIFLLGDAGRLLSIVLLIIQLTSCAGTFPLEVVPNFFKVMYPFMPFTYAVEALREVISATTINYSIIAKDVAILSVVLVVFLTVSVLLKNVGEKVTDSIEARKAA